MDLLSRSGVTGLGLRGVEREALRVDTAGRLAATPHPGVLGSALTHPNITTDYSEALIELVSSANASIEELMQELDQVHRFVQQGLGQESLWSASMPAELPSEAEIPIAWYGSSHIGMLKHVYRRGLAVRYGKAMQCIAGIHYNFSLPEQWWEILGRAEGSSLSARDEQSARYISLIRNFHRDAWLLMFLFGASPALSTGFLQGRPHQLQEIGPGTLSLPHATSLRMSDLGYQNKAQLGLIPPYNSLAEYMTGMARAVRLPWPEYEALGLQRDGEWIQISTNVLQIENEYYAIIRPKRVVHPGERPLQALCERGVQYVEVRCIDVDPFEPSGIGADTARFLDVFLTTCALSESPAATPTGFEEWRQNFASVVREGRRPGLNLQRDGQVISLHDWSLQLMDDMLPVAHWLDSISGGDLYQQALNVQLARVRNPQDLPSARVARAIQAQGGSFHRFALAQSEANRDALLARPLNPEQALQMRALAETSLASQKEMEARDVGSFDDFIEAYRQATPSQLCCD
jgi:glutamate--cysteine ligase